MASYTTAVLVDGDETVTAAVHGPADNPIASIQIGTDVNLLTIQTHHLDTEALIGLLNTAIAKLRDAHTRWVAEITPTTQEGPS